MGLWCPALSPKVTPGMLWQWHMGGLLAWRSHRLWESNISKQLHLCSDCFKRRTISVCLGWLPIRPKCLSNFWCSGSLNLFQVYKQRMHNREHHSPAVYQTFEDCFSEQGWRVRGWCQLHLNTLSRPNPPWLNFFNVNVCHTLFKTLYFYFYMHLYERKVREKLIPWFLFLFFWKSQ